MQYIPCNSALLAQETLFLTQKDTFLPKDLQKVRKSRQILICDKKNLYLGFKFSSGSKLFGGGLPVPPHNFCHPVVNIVKIPSPSASIVSIFDIVLFVSSTNL